MNMERIVDFHSHILPCIDDGSDSVEKSIAMLQEEYRQGITKVIATPHFYAQHDNVEHFLRKRAEAEQILREEMEFHMLLPDIRIGAEVYFFRGISETDLLPELTINGTDCVLIEMPHGKWTDSMYRELENIQRKQGLTPVIAHVDRYISRFNTHGIPERLTDLPVLVQANASFFLHRSTAHMAMRMLHRGQIHLLGSDCHNTDTRSPNLRAAAERIQKQLGQSAFDWIDEHQRLVLDH